MPCLYSQIKHPGDGTILESYGLPSTASEQSKSNLMLASQSLSAFSPSAEHSGHINTPTTVISIKDALQNNLEGTLAFMSRFELRHSSIYIHLASNNQRLGSAGEMCGKCRRMNKSCTAHTVYVNSLCCLTKETRTSLFPAPRYLNIFIPS